MDQKEGNFLPQKLKVKEEGDREEKLGSRENSRILWLLELGDIVPFNYGVLYFPLEVLE